MNNTKKINTIGVIGGGSAGYISALFLKKIFPNSSVTLIESSKIPVIGVGEATTPLLLNILHKNLGYSVREFFEKTKPTIKLGIKYDWGKPGDYYYNNPFGVIDIANALYHTQNFNNCSIVSQLMDAGKAPFIRQNDKIIPLKLSKGYAYHIDNKRFLAYLKEKLTTSGCNYIDTEITGTDKADGKNELEAVIDSNGISYSYDLYVDCSGFTSLLLNKALGGKWIDYSASLKTNRAIIGMIPNGGKVIPYTKATTAKYGWIWNTPMQEEDHLGYVFSKDFCTDDEAFDELKKRCTKVVDGKIIAFKTGRYENSFVENVVAIGNSFAFIEPLESTGIHMILFQLKKIQRYFGDAFINKEGITQYNEVVNGAWDHLKWFVAMHFKFNTKINSPFWQYCNNDIDMSGIEDYIEFYKANGPISYHKDHPLYEKMDKDSIFSAFSFDANIAGCGVNHKYFQQRNTHVNDAWPKQFKFNQQIINQALSHEEGLRYLEENETDFIQDWFVTS